jgi:hypothetical protein
MFRGQPLILTVVPALQRTVIINLNPSVFEGLSHDFGVLMQRVKLLSAV